MQNIYFDIYWNITVQLKVEQSQRVIKA